MGRWLASYKERSLSGLAVLREFCGILIKPYLLRQLKSWFSINQRLSYCEPKRNQRAGAPMDDRQEQFMMSFPPVNELSQMEPEEIGPFILRKLKGDGSLQNRYNFFLCVPNSKWLHS